MITSVDNPRVKDVLRLRKARERRRAGLFVAEGPREVERARAAGLTIQAMYFAPELIAWPHGGEEVSDRVLRKMTYRAEPEGVIAVVEQPRHELPRGGTLYLVAVGIEKPGNLGAMARSADAYNPNAIRASTGAVFSLPVVERRLDDVRALDTQLVAAGVDAPTRHTDADLARATAIAVGSEDTGLDERWLAAADVTVRIPMHGRTTDSLNASNAAAILLFEAARQRA